MDAKEFDHIPWDQLNPEQQAARRYSRAPHVAAAKRISADLDFRATGKIRGLNIYQDSDARDGVVGAMDGQVYDCSPLVREIIMQNVDQVSLHLLGLSPTLMDERKVINALLVKAGEHEVPEPDLTKEMIEREMLDTRHMLAGGASTPKGISVDMGDGYHFTIGLVLKSVRWMFDDEIQIVNLDDPDFNIIVDYYDF